MKTARVSLALNIVLIIAVLFLFIREFSEPGTAAGGESTTLADTTHTGIEALKDTTDISSIYQRNLVVAYINSDSINKNYKYLKEKEDELIKRSKESEARVKREMNKAQSRYTELMQKAQTEGFSSQQEYDQAAVELEELQMKIEQLRADEATSLSQVQRELQEQFSKKVTDFLEDYSNERNIDIVLSYLPGGQVLWASDSLEITQEVLEGLNDQYEAELNQPEKATNN